MGIRRGSDCRDCALREIAFAKKETVGSSCEEEGEVGFMGFKERSE